MSLVKGIKVTKQDTAGDEWVNTVVEGSHFDTREDILPELGVALSTVDLPITWEEAHGHVNVLQNYGEDITNYKIVFKFDTSDFGADEFDLLDGHRVAERIGLLIQAQLPDDDRVSAIYFMKDFHSLSFRPHTSGKWKNREFGAAFFVSGARRGKHSKRP